MRNVLYLGSVLTLMLTLTARATVPRPNVLFIAIDDMNDGITLFGKDLMDDLKQWLPSTNTKPWTDLKKPKKEHRP